MECPTCGKEVRTEHGVRQHHTKVHDENLPNRTCKGCEKRFYDPKSRRKYCENCNPNAGEHNGNWKGAKESAECRRCGSQFEYYPSDKEGVYCQRCVRESDEFLGDPYRKDAERFVSQCRNCGEEMIVLQTDWERGEGRFCCFDCLCKWMSKDGTVEETAYSRGWDPLKRRALRRDQHRCQNCGRTYPDLGQEPDVHHIDPIRNFAEAKEAHTIDNVVCLCRMCHRHVEIGNIPVPDSAPSGAPGQ